MTPADKPPALTALEARVRIELATIEAPLRDWVPQRLDRNGNALQDVVVVGGGLSGLSIAFGLLRQGVARVKVIDAAPIGREGPWVTSARMRTLRSPKTLSGPDLGIPALTYRSWHEARFGPEHWDSLDKIDRNHWMEYLIWFRAIVGIDVENDTKLLRIEPLDGNLSLVLESHGRERRMACRKIVLATGSEGAGGLNVPRLIADHLPRERWTHSGEIFDVTSLKDKTVGIIGSASSSFDWAVAALEAGARTVTMLARSAALPKTEILDWSNFPGFLNHFSELDDLRRYRFARRMFSFKTPPTHEMYGRAVAFENFHFVSGAGLQSATMQDEAIALATGAGSFTLDHLLLGTGYAVELERRPELSGFVQHIARWSDRFAAPEDEVDTSLLAYPYLGQAFEFTEKVPGAAPFLSDIHVFNHGAVPSLGPVCNGITGLKSGVPKIVAGVMRGLFMADADLHYSALDSYSKVHFDPNVPHRP